MPTPSQVNTDLPTVNTQNNNSEVKKLSFWVSQFFILIATVVGVYLAATQGFKQAMQFDNIMSVKNAYYLQVSLRNEVHNNMQALDVFLDKAKNARSPFDVYPLETSSFVWGNMGQSATTLTLRPSILASSEQFMRGLQISYTKATTGAIEQRQKGLAELTELSAMAKTQLLVELDTSITELKKQLTDWNVKLL